MKTFTFNINLVFEGRPTYILVHFVIHKKHLRKDTKILAFVKQDDDIADVICTWKPHSVYF